MTNKTGSDNTHTQKIPKTRLERGLSSTKIAARIGTNQVRYLMKRPFLSEEGRNTSREQRDRENAQTLFNGLALLKGTALKAAQMLSFEHELLPKAFQTELEKSYYQVPPINRALVRKLITTSLHEAPENLFSRFDTKAFAAASLGQVHRAVSKEGLDLAVKIQYPDMRKTIDGDIQMLGMLARPMADFKLIKPALDEIRDVLLAETDYLQETENIEFFRTHLNMDRVTIPTPDPSLSSDRVLTMSFLDGQILSQWLKKNPSQEARNQVAQTLNDIFIRSFYELNVVHADPNPGNFLVRDNLCVGLLDFGCIRRVRPEFVAQYQELIQLDGTREGYLDLLTRMNFISKDLAPQAAREVLSAVIEMGTWLKQLFQQEYFDFREHPDFIARGRRLGAEFHRLSRHIKGFPPELVFLDRTRYGLTRLYEQMGVKIRLRNHYEFNDGIRASST